MDLAGSCLPGPGRIRTSLSVVRHCDDGVASLGQHKIFETNLFIKINLDFETVSSYVQTANMPVTQENRDAIGIGD